MNFSVIVVTNRGLEYLREVLDACFSQHDCTIEIIVILNGVVPEEIPKREHLKFIQLHENRGAVARNEGFRVAQGNFIVCVDDDVIFKDGYQLSKLNSYFQGHPEVSAVDFKVLSPKGGLDHYSWCHPRDRRTYADTCFETHYISEGAVAFRREVFEILGGGYYEPLFIGHEGEDLALRMLDKGMKIFYLPVVEVIHSKSEVARAKGRSYYYNTRNGIWIAWKNFPVIYAFLNSVRTVMIMFFFTIRSGNWKSYFHGIHDGIFGLPVVLLDRKPISKTTIKEIRSIVKNKPSLIKRFMEHIFTKVL